jgi:FtsP/CotA-like multicopper oxidase with cupredoxin domain
MRQTCHATNLKRCLGALVVPALLTTLSCERNDVRQANLPVRSSRPLINVPGTALELTAQRMTTSLRDGTSVPMWGFCPTGSCASSWAPGPTIYATAGTSLQINLTNALPVPTSLVVLGQLGGGLGAPQKMASPPHPGQNYTTFPGNAQVNTDGTNAFVPPAQGPRVRSFGAEAAAASGSSSGTVTLTWDNL